MNDGILVIQKREEENFIEQFFQVLFSAIKKRFPIQSVITKYKNRMSKFKILNLWIPQASEKGIRVNESFVLAYALNNSEQKLRIEIMNLLKENLPLPLYTK